MEDADSLNRKAVRLHGEGKSQEAYECMKRAVAIVPESISFLRNMGAILVELRRFAEAIPYLDKCLKDKYCLGIEGELEVCHIKAMALFGQKKYSEVVYFLTDVGETYLVKPGSKKRLLLKGIFLRQWGEEIKSNTESRKYFDKAIQCFDTILEKDPEYKHAWYERGIALQCRAGLWFVVDSEFEEFQEAGRRYNLCISNEITKLLDELSGWSSRGGCSNALSNCDKALALDSERVPLKVEPAGTGSRKIEILAHKAYFLLEEEKFQEAIQLCDEILKESNFSKKYRVDVLETKGFAFYRLGRYSDAIKGFDMALEISPQDANILKNKALVLFLQGYREKSLEFFNKSLEVKADLMSALQGKAILFLVFGRRMQAEKLFAECDSIEVKEKSLCIKQSWLIQRGDLYFAAEFFEEARGCFEKAVSIDSFYAAYPRKRLKELEELEKKNATVASNVEPQKPQLPQEKPAPSVPVVYTSNFFPSLSVKEPNMIDSRAISELQEKGKFEEVIRLCEEVIKSDPKNDFAWAFLGDAKRLVSRDEKAIQDFDEAIRLNRKNDFAWARRGDSKRKLKRYDEAIRDLNEALRLNPENADALMCRSNAKRMMGHYDEAMGDIKEAIRLNPNNSAIWQEQGLLNYQLGRFKEAIQDFDEAIKVNSLCAWTWGIRGISKRMLGNYEEAIEDLKESLRLEPTDKFAQEQLEETQKQRAEAHYKNREYKEVIFVCLPALQLDPPSSWAKLLVEGVVSNLNKVIASNSGDYKAWENRAAAKYLLDNYEEATQDFGEALRLNPKSDFAWEWRGELRFKLRRYEEAMQDFEEVLKLNPNSDFAKRRFAEAKKQSEIIKEELEKRRAAAVSKTEPQKPQTPPDRPAPSAPVLTGYSFPRPSAPLLTGYSFPRSSSSNSSAVAPASIYSSGMCLRDEPKPLQNTALDSDVLAISRRNLVVTERVLGRGFFGIVYLGHWRRAEDRVIDVAVKQLQLEALPESSRGNFKKEIAIQANIDCPYVVKLLGVTLPDDTFSYSMIIEYMDCGSLYNMLNEIPPEALGWDVKMQIAIDVATGLIYLHGKNPRIVHGDIKSLNILLSGDGYAKIADFGLASLRKQLNSRCYVSDTPEKDSGMGSLLWKPLELFTMNVKQVPECDMYSFGILLWEIAVHDVPYSCANGSYETIKQFKKENQRDEFDERAAGMPEQFQFVSEQCWEADSKKRLTSKQALEKLQEASLYKRNRNVRLLFPPRKTPEPKTSSSLSDASVNKLGK